MYIADEARSTSYGKQALIWKMNAQANTPDEVTLYEALRDLPAAEDMIYLFEDALDEWREAPGCPRCRQKCHALANTLGEIFSIGAAA